MRERRGGIVERGQRDEAIAAAPELRRRCILERFRQQRIGEHLEAAAIVAVEHPEHQVAHHVPAEVARQIPDPNDVLLTAASARRRLAARALRFAASARCSFDTVLAISSRLKSKYCIEATISASQRRSGRANCHPAAIAMISARILRGRSCAPSAIPSQRATPKAPRRPPSAGRPRRQIRLGGRHGNRFREFGGMRPVGVQTTGCDARTSLLRELVGVRGFEPPASTSRT